MIARESGEDDSADDGPRPWRQWARPENSLDEGGGAHRPDAERRRYESERDESQMIGYRQHGRRRSGDEIRCAAETLHRQGRRQGGRDDRAGVAERIRAHDQFEGVEGARQRRRESGRDRPRRAATDQSAQVLPTQSQEDAGPRGDRRADLGVTGLEPHRGATAVGDQGLRDHKEAVAERELSAVQGVGLDWIDGRRRFSRAPPSIHEPEREPAETKRGQRGDRANPGAGAQPLVERQPIDPDVREFRDFRHRDHADSRDGADEDRDRHLRKSVRANERAQGRRRGGERAPGKDRHCRTRIAVMPRPMDHSQARGQQKILGCRSAGSGSVISRNYQAGAVRMANIDSLGFDGRLATRRRILRRGLAYGPYAPEGVEVDPQRITAMILGSAKTAIR